MRITQNLWLSSYAMCVGGAMPVIQKKKKLSEGDWSSLKGQKWGKKKYDSKGKTKEQKKLKAKLRTEEAKPIPEYNCRFCGEFLTFIGPRHYVRILWLKKY